MTEQQPEQEGYLDDPAFDWTEYEVDVRELCVAKTEEFALLGYEDVSPEAVWSCVTAKWKERPALHVAVAEILRLQIGQLMNHLTMNAFKGKFEDDEAPFEPIRPSGMFDRSNNG